MSKYMCGACINEHKQGTTNRAVLVDGTSYCKVHYLEKFAPGLFKKRQESIDAENKAILKTQTAALVKSYNEPTGSPMVRRIEHKGLKPEDIPSVRRRVFQKPIISDSKDEKAAEATKKPKVAKEEKTESVSENENESSNEQVEFVQ